MIENRKKPLILLTGATGYVGGRLLKILQQSDYRVRCVARRPEYLKDRVAPTTEVVQGDVLDKSTLHPALTNVHTAYYMIHSMGADQDFERLDREGAQNFGKVASENGVRRIIYLGGLGDSQKTLSRHLRSRQEVCQVLASYGVPVVELRASIVIGAESLSFEMVRALTERLPVMITPRWVSVKAQPIAISDLLAYLVAALDVEADGHRIFEIGGPDQVSYGDLIREYARQRGLHRTMIRVPVLTPRLSSLWLGLVTPLYARIGRKLVDSIQHPTVVTDDTALQVFDVRPMGIQQAIRDALRDEDQELVQTRWSDALSSAGLMRSWGGVRFRNRLVDVREVTVPLSEEKAFAPINRIGGKTGWYFGDWLWRLRGFMDLLVGGVGMRRGRPDPGTLRVGDTLDFWRVEAVEPNRRLLLQAEMKLPGRAWLEFEVKRNGNDTIIKQTAMFDPVGLPGIIYWYGIYPFHSLVFKRMLLGIADAAKKQNKEDQK